MAITITQTINDAYDLQREFKACNRDYFTIEGYQAMFDMIDSLGEDFELDVIALCCDYRQDDLESVLESYGLDSFEEIADNTYTVMLDNGQVFYQRY